jgi:hypothetical protein
MAWYICISFRAHETKWGAALFEDGVEEHAEPGREFDVVAGVAEPCCAEGCRAFAGGEEGWGVDCYVGRCRVWPFQFACYSAPVYILLAVIWEANWYAEPYHAIAPAIAIPP